ncbi:MAG TPA: carbon storage regulator [Pirellulales bacterium]|jgi:carbon storage regulator|nr:carbon storage regulator [Pirellulales bacterium]
MLILQRRIGESVIIGNGIIVTVMNVRGKAVTLGIQAPRQISIRRSELGPHPSRPGHQATGAAEEQPPVYETRLHQCPNLLCL